MRSTDIIFVPVLAIASAMALGCNRDANEPGEAGTKTIAASDTKDTKDANKTVQPGGQAAAGVLTESSREFLLAAATDGVLEVEAGKLAESRAQTEPVKQFAKMMVEHHTKANEELAKLARSMSIDVPKALDENAQDKLDDLRDESGLDFDEEYLDLMIDEHQRVIRNFEREAERNDEPQPVRSWASQTLPTLRTHLDRAKATEDELAKTPAATPDATSPGAASQQEAGGDTKTGDTKTGDTKTGDTKTGDTKTGDAKTGTTKSGDAKTGTTKTGTTK
jgi:putative membrane protein